MRDAKRKSKKNWLNVTIPLIIYPFDVIVSLGEDDAQMKRRLREKGIKWDRKLKYTTAGKFVLMSDNKAIIRLYRIPSTPEDYGTLAHEIFHSVECILSEIGMSLSEYSHEAYAYLIGYITQEVYKHLKP